MPTRDGEHDDVEVLAAGGASRALGVGPRAPVRLERLRRRSGGVASSWSTQRRGREARQAADPHERLVAVEAAARGAPGGRR